MTPVSLRLLEQQHRRELSECTLYKDMGLVEGTQKG